MGELESIFPIVPSKPEKQGTEKEYAHRFLRRPKRTNPPQPPARAAAAPNPGDWVFVSAGDIFAFSFSSHASSELSVVLAIEEYVYAGVTGVTGAVACAAATVMCPSVVVVLLPAAFVAVSETVYDPAVV